VPEHPELSAFPPETHTPSSAAPDARPEWTSPLPDRLPRPTYAPAALAFGIVLILWGFVTTWIISLVGMALFAVALAIWIREVQHADG